MRRIVSAEGYLSDIPVERPRTDAVQAFLKQETIFVEIEADDGARGIGYSYTIGTGGSSVLELLRTCLLPALVGEDPMAVEGIWSMLFARTRATTGGPITSLALAAVDTALWDLKCMAASQPLWLLAGGARRRVPLYDTEGGWLQLGADELVRNAQRARANEWAGIKVKIGKPDAHEDVERIAAVREAIGPRMQLMVDANQCLTVAEAQRRARLLEPYDIAWLEEPLPADDIQGHELLARSTNIPIAVGESIYSISHFREYLARAAASIVQVDAARIGGITPWLKVAHMAEAFNTQVAPHFLMELHVSLAAAVPNGMYVEHIPQLRQVTTREVNITEGHACAPSTPGLGIAWNRQAIDELRVQ